MFLPCGHDSFDGNQARRQLYEQPSRPGPGAAAPAARCGAWRAKLGPRNSKRTDPDVALGLLGTVENMADLSWPSRPADAAQVIRVWRRRVAETQANLAKALNVTFSTVSRWENGHVRPSKLAWRALQRLAAERACPLESNAPDEAKSSGSTGSTSEGGPGENMAQWPSSLPKAEDLGRVAVAEVRRLIKKGDKHDETKST
jgi:putative transcriptional regulator